MRYEEVVSTAYNELLSTDQDVKIINKVKAMFHTKIETFGRNTWVLGMSKINSPKQYRAYLTSQAEINVLPYLQRIQHRTHQDQRH